jgi:hypothetical protein
MNLYRRKKKKAKGRVSLPIVRGHYLLEISQAVFSSERDPSPECPRNNPKQHQAVKLRSSTTWTKKLLISSVATANVSK